MGGEGKRREMEVRKEEGEEKKGREVITMGFSLQKVNFLVTSLLVFSFIDNEIEAVGAYIK